MTGNPELFEAIVEAQLEEIGNAMSNVLFNLSQGQEIDERTITLMRGLAKQWGETLTELRRLRS